MEPLFKKGDEVAGRYIVEGIIGDGGFSDVVKVFDNEVSRYFAMKILLDNPRPSGTAAEQPEPYNIAFAHKSEAQAGFDMVKHPNLIQLYHSLTFEHNGHDHHALLMQLVEGETLEKKVRKDTYCEEDCIELLLKITGAVGAIHKQGMVHGDPSQRNIIIREEDGEPMMGDYYLFRQSSIMIRSPETIINGEYAYISEIYSLGCLGLYTLTGIKPFHYNYDDSPTKEQRPFIKERITVGDMYPEDTMKWLKSLRLGRILLKAADKDPTKRYQSCDELIKKLTPATFSRRALLSAGIGIGVLALVGGFFYTVKKNSSKIFYATHKLSLDMSDGQWAERCREILEYELSKPGVLLSESEIREDNLPFGVTMDGTLVYKNRTSSDGSHTIPLGVMIMLSENKKERDNLEQRMNDLLENLAGKTDMLYCNSLGMVMDNSFRWVYEHGIFPNQKENFLSIIKTSLDTLNVHLKPIPEKEDITYFRIDRYNKKSEYAEWVYGRTNGEVLPLYLFYAREKKSIEHFNSAYQAFQSFIWVDKTRKNKTDDLWIHKGYHIIDASSANIEVDEICYTRDLALTAYGGIDIYQTSLRFKTEELAAKGITQKPLEDILHYSQEKMKLLEKVVFDTAPLDLTKPSEVTDSYAHVLTAKVFLKYADLLNELGQKQESQAYIEKAKSIMIDLIPTLNRENKQGAILTGTHYEKEGNVYSSYRRADAELVDIYLNFVNSVN